MVSRSWYPSSPPPACRSSRCPVLHSNSLHPPTPFHPTPLHVLIFLPEKEQICCKGPHGTPKSHWVGLRNMVEIHWVAFSIRFHGLQGLPHQSPGTPSSAATGPWGVGRHQGPALGYDGTMAPEMLPFCCKVHEGPFLDGARFRLQGLVAPTNQITGFGLPATRVLRDGECELGCVVEQDRNRSTGSVEKKILKQAFQAQALKIPKLDSRNLRILGNCDVLYLPHALPSSVSVGIIRLVKWLRVKTRNRPVDCQNEQNRRPLGGRPTGLGAPGAMANNIMAPKSIQLASRQNSSLFAFGSFKGGNK